MISQGDEVWVEMPEPIGSEAGGRRPAVVLQTNRFNRSRIQTVIVAAITSNLRYANLPGNVRIAKGEASLPKPSVVNVSQIAAIDRRCIKSVIGRFTKRRLKQIRDGIDLIIGLEEE